MAKYSIDGSTLQGIGDSIRVKTGSTSALTPAQMITAIGGISSGGSGGSTYDTLIISSDTSTGAEAKAVLASFATGRCVLTRTNGGVARQRFAAAIYDNGSWVYSFRMNSDAGDLQVISDTYVARLFVGDIITKVPIGGV